MHHGRVGYHTDITALSRDPCLAQWNNVIFGRNFFLDATVQIFVLKKNDRIIVANGSFDQSLGVVRRSWADHLQPRIMHEPHLWILRMKWTSMNVAAARPTQDQR